MSSTPSSSSSSLKEASSCSADNSVAAKAVAANESLSSITTTTVTPQLKILFIHLDLGIGGAEQLVLQLALATTSQRQQQRQQLQEDVDDETSRTVVTSSRSSVHIITTRCDPNHCFQEFKPPNGVLYRNVQVVGRWLTPNIFGYFTAFCSSLRMLYLSLYVITDSYWNSRTNRPDVIVLDVLPTSIPLLRYFLPKTGILFYCHFPDKLLTRDTVNGEQELLTTSSRSKRSWLSRLYRTVLNELEEYTLNAAHVICVNSKFTKTTVQRVFESLKERDMDVLYPAISPSSSSPPVVSAAHPTEKNVLPVIEKTRKSPIVSLNRFERKKNVELLLYAYSELVELIKKSPSQELLPKVIIAGGYDPENVENIEYMGELRRLTTELGLEDMVEFCPSISDQRRTELLQTALCVVYTPHLEHFGIVPLEAMLAGTPVVCVNSGGPLETVVDGVTGRLCDPTPRAFGQALHQLVECPDVATQMGRNAMLHVQTRFGVERFRCEWYELLEKTVQKAKLANAQHESALLRQRRPMLWSSFKHIVFESIMVLLVLTFLTRLLKLWGWMDQQESILGKLRRTLWRDDEL